MAKSKVSSKDTPRQEAMPTETDYKTLERITPIDEAINGFMGTKKAPGRFSTQGLNGRG